MARMANAGLKESRGVTGIDQHNADMAFAIIGVMILGGSALLVGSTIFVVLTVLL